MDNHLNIRPAQRGDLDLIIEFITGLAHYEKMEDEVCIVREELEHWLFDKHTAEVIIAEYDGVPAGFTLFFHNFSTFLGKPGIYIEDIFVLPPMRGKGIGTALLKHVAGIARERKCGRVDWCCLDWNEPSIRFYESMGAVMQGQWKIFRLDGAAIDKLASSDQ